MWSRDKWTRIKITLLSTKDVTIKYLPYDYEEFVEAIHHSYVVLLPKSQGEVLTCTYSQKDKTINLHNFIKYSMISDIHTVPLTAAVL